MKKLLFICLLFSLLCCKSVEPNAIQNKNTSMENCPDDGVCSVVLLQNKTLNVLSDDLGGLYVTLTDNPNTHVFHYQYKRNVPDDLQDGHHVEEVYWEINAIDKNLLLENESLQDVKMIFGRHCYCKGQAGYFKINSGTLELDKREDGYVVKLNFETKEVPQLLNAVTALVQ
jgi:hypothetical protein